MAKLKKAKVFKNSANGQFNFNPNKKLLSKEDMKKLNGATTIEWNFIENGKKKNR